MSTGQRKSAAKVITDTAEKVERKIEGALTVLWDDLPSWQQDNKYIFSGYRTASGSFKRSFSSLGYLHNESVNIYSHLVGAIGFTIAGSVLYTVVRPRYETATQSDCLAFGAFFLGAAACLGMSATYHAISNHSPMVAKFGNKLDYVGIVSLITGSFLPTIYYGFYCHPHLQEAYWLMICSLGVGCACVSILERFRTPDWRPYRAAMFVAQGLSGVLPLLHGVRLYGLRTMQYRVGFLWILLEGAMYILGAGLYAARWPERSSPGRYDIWGSSHQIFHFLVVLAAISHLYALLVAFDYNHIVLERKC
ncbi:hemolysin-III channel protein-like protein Izh2 [Calycina marina]|uniref:Hemolysin-III channel protein-like protein Izh2 n=1 Tax=Calycina marina TaxID=1763456 RepID=A0A9P8CB30_9HELO|nr:hemolysin-III channel protein-like protein Izh2 [Calycina marina]